MDHRENELLTKKIKVYGIVQGVGFRPLVYHIAKKLDLIGTVRNVGGYVEIILKAEERKISTFLEELTKEEEHDYELINIEVEEYPDIRAKDFTILESGNGGDASVIPPDLPVCRKCLEELYDAEDRRYQNSFISCTSCGPRYTIIEELPYDRQHTSMVDFSMCTDCEKEYKEPEHRRHHAQTISCNDCGPFLIYSDNSFNHLKSARELKNQEALEKGIAALLEGGILAVKGIGGYHFVCSPFREETVLNLRRLKGREEKPFAVMFETIDMVKEYCEVSAQEQALLESKARPIVLLYMHENTMATSVNKGSIYCGSFLPYTPLQKQLTKACGPLIMTSANQSNQPIIREDEKMLALQSPYLTGVLYNGRRILRSVDDSVAKIVDGKPQLIRRSRGYVPYPVFLSQVEVVNRPEAEIFAAGGDLKAAFCLYHKGNAVVSQYIGDLEEEAVMEDYKKTYEDLTKLLKISPSLAICDMHPNYYSAQFTKELRIPILQVQHHHAHIASAMAEHHLKGRVIGVAYDGTGYGTDGNVWGGEFLICEESEFLRAGHLKYTLMLGGDKSMKDAKKTATCFLINSDLDEYVEDDRKGIIKAALNYRANTVLSSSMGRLFDAAASILNVKHRNQYEGECATFLEMEAVKAIRNNVKPQELSFAIRENDGIIELDPKPILEEMYLLRQTKEIGSLALGFHVSLAKATGSICEILRKKYDTNTVALSGGVFQNSVLTELTLKILKEKKFLVYMNTVVPPGDGGISLGQVYVGRKMLKYKEKMKSLLEIKRLRENL